MSERVEDMIAGAEASVARQKEKDELLRDMAHELRCLEWQGSDAHAYPACPSCGEDRPHDPIPGYEGHHRQDCELIALLSRYAALYPNGAVEEGR